MSVGRKAKSKLPQTGLSIRRKAYLSIQRKIASGEFPAGKSLSELALASELGISRTPVREALSQLVAEGFLEQTPNRGAVVVQLTRQDVVNLYELREALEVYAIGKVARRQVQETDLERLRLLADDVLTFKRELEQSGKPALDEPQMQRFINADLAFHAMLIREAANARILKIVNETRLLIRIFGMRHQGHMASELDVIWQAHRNLLQAVELRDVDRAQKLMTEHIQTSQRERLDAFDHWEREHSLHACLPAFFNWPTDAFGQ